MMATTHALAGLALGAVVATLVPEFGAVALLAGLVGGAVPDLDLYAGHRRTLHFPVWASLATVPLAGVAVVAPSAVTVGTVTFVAAAAAHAASDALGGGLELRPWRANSERAVYDHFHGRWIRPRRWIRYDGAPEDALLGAVLAVPALSLAGDVHPAVVPVIGAVLSVSAGYALVRRHVPALTEAAVSFVPPGLEPYVPDRFVDGA